ncbi:hypothetical protein KPH14_010416 [Odynerus spinipes]|uniref:Uncharacterized protein n=1 Tax=Odynerus spinipes TaxID=1348599 RepID=A0AAD9RUF2_9HYME|nr:hypothetical protein KPH14_010416 [Odynerus spinipes]
METFQLYYMKRAFAPLGNRFTHLRAEAIRLKYLWSYEKRPNRRHTDQELRTLYKEATNYVNNNKKLSEASKLIKKMLKHEPRSPEIHILRGTLYELQEKWTDAIRNYEVARLMQNIALYRTSRYTEDSIPYVESLIKCYKARGDSNYECGLFFEAASDYERVLALKPPGASLIEVEDKILRTMKELEKYEAFYSYWLEFMQTSNSTRVSDLLTFHAEYKFYLRDIESTRELLLEALDLNGNNTRARQLLQKMYELGHTMAIHAIIWCMHRCFDKALYTIEKVRDCDPSNLQYILLKAIIFRLSGRSQETIACLGQTRDVLEGKMDFSRDTTGTSLPLFSIEEIKKQIKKQFLLARYNNAIQPKIEKKN